MRDTRKRKFVFVLALQAVSCASSCLLYFLVWKRWRLGMGLITIVRCYCHVFYCGNWLIQIIDPLILSLFIFLFRVHGWEIIEVNLYPLDPIPTQTCRLTKQLTHTHTHIHTYNYINMHAHTHKHACTRVHTQELLEVDIA